MKESKYLELLNNNNLKELKEKLENEIRKQGALKTNSKSRFNALERLNKENEKKCRVNLKGYGIKDDKYYFTNSYMYAILNDNCNMKENDRLPVEGIYNIDKRLKLDKIYVSIEDLSYYVKTKSNYTNDYFERTDFDYNLLKYAIDILGTKDIEIFTNQDKSMLIFMNKELEKVVVLGSRVY